MRKERALKIGVYVAIFVAWEIGVRSFEVHKFLLSSPLEIIAEIGKNHSRLLFHLQGTFLEVIGGLGLALAAAIIFSAISVHSRFFEVMIYPLIAGLQTVPWIGIAPLLAIWFGYGSLPKIIISGFMSFFPLVINLTKGLGLKNISSDNQDWLKVYRANKWEVFWRVRVPNSLPDFFAGLKTGVLLAIKGAIIGEFILGGDRGIGHYIIRASSYFNTALMFGAMLFLALMGMALFQLVKFAEKKVIGRYSSGENDKVSI